ncbi:putative mitochondrial protein AtMg00310 [Apium graveolens]|uniref:putative mitochondrial protein AtMg00310 n=1 Tax=Apium graveolens TaxID=4045 RepID=UPI003D7B43C0
MASILQKYERLSGQKINFGKSDIVFSPNTCELERRGICVMLEVKLKDKSGKYLGMPMYIGRNKREIFGFISDKIKSKLQSWSNNELSKGGKLKLVGTSTQTTPNFWMSLFLIPDSICDEVERKMNAFLWGNAAGRGVKWIIWKKMCVPKGFGGLGLKELKRFNMAMLARQSWRLRTEVNTLVSAIMNARYYPQTEVIDAELGNNHSYVWRGIFASLEILKIGAHRRIGNGESTLVWRDQWLPDISSLI